ncbi:hypothetical protein L1887_19640 [Cichorium endivia]|nr:hypothetical protein L1887_19640 [Cichorium endivia]
MDQRRSGNRLAPEGHRGLAGVESERRKFDTVEKEAVQPEEKEDEKTTFAKEESGNQHVSIGSIYNGIADPNNVENPDVTKSKGSYRKLTRFIKLGTEEGCQP